MRNLVFQHYSEFRKKTRKNRKCWLCGEPIPTGTAYFIHSGIVNGKWFKFPTHGMRAVEGGGTDCCLAHEILHDNPQLRPRVFYPTLAEPKKPEVSNG